LACPFTNCSAGERFLRARVCGYTPASPGAAFQDASGLQERTKELIAKGATGGKTDFFGGTPLDRELTSQNLYDARE
jgi:hypothetical protein